MRTVHPIAVGIVRAGVLLWLDGVKAQFTNATCSSSFDWAFNSKNQSPCVVASYLSAVCNATYYFLPALPRPTDYYTGPYAGTFEANCYCSSITYQLYSACGACQGRPFTTWDNWIPACASNQTVIGKFPFTIQGATAVPAWALIDPTMNSDHTFDPGAAAIKGDMPELTASNSTSSPTSSSSSSSSSTSTSSHSSNTGAIVGGVVGGVVGLALIALIIFLVLRRRRRRTRPAKSTLPKLMVQDGANQDSPTEDDKYTAIRSPVSFSSHMATTGARTDIDSTTIINDSSGPGTDTVYPRSLGYGFTESSGTTPRKLYDPQDPLTWPPDIALVPNRATPQQGAEYAVSDLNYRHAHPGVPEV